MTVTVLNKIKHLHRLPTVYNGKITYFAHSACRCSWIKFQACQARLCTCSKWSNICASHLPITHFEPCSKCLGTRCDNVKNKFAIVTIFHIYALFSIKKNVRRDDLLTSRSNVLHNAFKWGGFEHSRCHSTYQICLTS